MSADREPEPIRAGKPVSDKLPAVRSARLFWLATSAVGRTRPMSKAKFGLQDCWTPEPKGSPANDGASTPKGRRRCCRPSDFGHRAFVAVDRSGRANFKLLGNAIARLLQGRLPRSAATSSPISLSISDQNGLLRRRVSEPRVIVTAPFSPRSSQEPMLGMPLWPLPGMNP